MTQDNNSEQMIGLALSGGSVRAAAQIGALAVLDEHNIPLHIISGTSAGSAVGALYAAGLSPKEMMEFMAGLSWPKTTKFAGTHELGMFSTSPFGRMLERALGRSAFGDLQKKLFVITCDVLTGDRVVISEGDVASAVVASTAIPGLFTPVEYGDRLLVDGGAVDNYPVTVPYLEGADIVIGIDIGAHPHEHAPRNAIEVLMASMEVRGRATGVRVADVDIVPDVRGFSSFDFDSIDEMHARGRAAAEQAVPTIEAVLSR